MPRRNHPRARTCPTPITEPETPEQLSPWELAIELVVAGAASPVILSDGPLPAKVRRRLEADGNDR